MSDNCECGKPMRAVAAADLADAWCCSNPRCPKYGLIQIRPEAQALTEYRRFWG